MTEFPALRDALVVAGVRRRRRRRRALSAVPVLAAAAAAVALFALPASAPERERTADPPPDAIAAAFPVFQRPQSAADKLPVREPWVGTVDEARTRLVADDGAMRIYAYPTSRMGGAQWVCLTIVGGGPSRTGCTPVAAVIDESTPIAVPGTGAWAQLFLEGTRDVFLILDNGRRMAVPIHNNLVFLTPRFTVVGASWTGPSGRRHILQTGAPISPVPPPATCPDALGPLPPDAAARAQREALIAVDALYPGAFEAEVTGTARPLSTPCPALAARSLEVRLRLERATARTSASLAHGRLLLGMVDGHMQVYYLLD